MMLTEPASGLNSTALYIHNAYPWRDGQAEFASVAWFVPRLYASEQPPILVLPQFDIVTSSRC